MSWNDYLKSVAIPIPIPMEFSTYIQDGVEHVAVEVTVRCHETGETIKVKTRQPVLPLGEMTNNEAARVVRDLARIAICHEIDEAISIDGDRVFNPHNRKVAR